MFVMPFILVYVKMQGSFADLFESFVHTHGFVAYIWDFLVTWFIHLSMCKERPVKKTCKWDLQQKHLKQQFIHLRDVNHSYIWHGRFICITWCIDMYEPVHLHVWHNTSMRLTCPMHTCDLTHDYVWLTHTWFSHICAMTVSYVSYDSFICETRLWTYVSTYVRKACEGMDIHVYVCMNQYIYMY